MAGLSFRTRVWVCSCGYKRNLFGSKSSHDEWEQARKVRIPDKKSSRSYNYIHCLDCPEINKRGDKSKKEACKCGGSREGDCDQGTDGSSCSGSCSGCK